MNQTLTTVNCSSVWLRGMYRKTAKCCACSIRSLAHTSYDMACSVQIPLEKKSLTIPSLEDWNLESWLW